MHGGPQEIAGLCAEHARQAVHKEPVKYPPLLHTGPAPECAAGHRRAGSGGLHPGPRLLRQARGRRALLGAVREGAHALKGELARKVHQLAVLRLRLACAQRQTGASTCVRAAAGAHTRLQGIVMSLLHPEHTKP